MKLWSQRRYRWSKKDRKKINDITNLISSGGIGIFPTDTVYGLGASPQYPQAIRKIYRLKKRDPAKPLINLVGHKKDVLLFTKDIPARAKHIIKRFWPGPLTLILKTSRGTAGLRMPKHKVALSILRKTGPLATTSANFSGHKPPIKFSQINQKLLKNVDFAIDGGTAPLKNVSTIVDCTGGEVRILRKGVISERQIKSTIKTDRLLGGN